MLLVFANLVFAVIYAWLVRFDCCFQSRNLVTSHHEPFMCSPSLSHLPKPVCHWSAQPK